MKTCNLLSNAIFVQRDRLLKMLQQGSCTTFEARHKLDIVQPAARIFELRHKYGYNIITHWENDINPGGGKHRIAKYVLMSGLPRRCAPRNDGEL